MWRPLQLGLVVVYLLVGTLSATETEFDLIQPTQSRFKIVLQSARGSARVQREDARPQKIPLRSDEVLTTIAETRDGWTAAGLKEQEEGTELLIIRRNGQGLRRLPSPTPQRHALRLRPTLVLGGGDLDGVAWLEGTHLGALSVRTASWLHDHWDEVTIVAPPARGSQTGLVATELAGGQWLLAWSAFDGQDDDILWSVGINGDFSTPRRVGKNNHRPDISPSLVTTSEGALLAWSRMIDGEYRLMMARFDGNAWSSPRPIGPAGSLAPGFILRDGQLHLLYRHAWPRGWALTEISSAGRLQRLAVTANEGRGRPALMSADGKEAQLRFADGRQERIQWEALP